MMPNKPKETKGNAFKMSSSNRTSKRHSRENWAEEVIAAAMKTGSNEGEIPDKERHESSRGDDSTEDEGIVSDESPPSSSCNDEILINHQDLKDLDLDKDVLQVDKRRTNVGQRTK